MKRILFLIILVLLLAFSQESYAAEKTASNNRTSVNTTINKSTDPESNKTDNKTNLNQNPNNNKNMGASEWITLSGVIASSIFSLLLLRFTKHTTEATKESAKAAVESANVAKASFEIANQMRIAQEQNKKALRNEYKRIIYMNAKKVAKAVDSQIITENYSVNTDAESVKRAPISLGVSEENLALYFTKEEIEIIHRVWETYNYWLENYWLNGSWPGDAARIMAIKVDEPRQALYDFFASFKNQ